MLLDLAVRLIINLSRTSDIISPDELRSEYSPCAFIIFLISKKSWRLHQGDIIGIVGACLDDSHLDRTIANLLGTSLIP